MDELENGDRMQGASLDSCPVFNFFSSLLYTLSLYDNIVSFPAKNDICFGMIFQIWGTLHSEVMVNDGE